MKTTTILTIAQATDKALAELEFALFRKNSTIEALRKRDWVAHIIDVKNLEAEVAKIEADIAKLDGVFVAMGGWERYVIVPGGHIHAYGCSTVYATTQTVDAYQYSAVKVEELIEKAGDRACTVCFPDAPVNKPSTIDVYVKEREAKEAEAAERDLKKAEAKAKALTDANGKVVFKTERAMTNELSRVIESYLMFNAYYPQMIIPNGEVIDNPQTMEDRLNDMTRNIVREELAIADILTVAKYNGIDLTERIAKTFEKKMKEFAKHGAVFSETMNKF